MHCFGLQLLMRLIGYAVAITGFTISSTNNLHPYLSIPQTLSNLRHLLLFVYSCYESDTDHGAREPVLSCKIAIQISMCING